MVEILKLLEQDGRLTAKQIAAMTGRAESDVLDIIKRCEDDGTILKYTAVVNYNESKGDMVTALIELKISPQNGDGYDRIARRIYQYDEVESLYLMTGSYDLLVVLSASSMKDAAKFVYEHLAVIEGVTATATHFIMKKYKERACIFDKKPEQEERLYFT